GINVGHLEIEHEVSAGPTRLAGRRLGMSGTLSEPPLGEAHRGRAGWDFYVVLVQHHTCVEQRGIKGGESADVVRDEPALYKVQGVPRALRRQSWWHPDPPTGRQGFLRS